MLGQVGMDFETKNGLSANEKPKQRLAKASVKLGGRISFVVM